MEALAATLEGLALAEWLRFSRWGYAALNATHILGFALLIGANSALDLRLIGLWETVSLTGLYRVLSSVAFAGLSTAVVTGSILFAVRATEYLELSLLFVKLGLIATATLFAAIVHFRFQLESLSRVQQRVIGIVSLLLWIAVLFSGRLLAFM